MILNQHELSYIVNIVRATGHENDTIILLTTNWHFIKTEVKDSAAKLEKKPTAVACGHLASRIYLGAKYLNEKEILFPWSVNQQKQSPRVRFLRTQIKTLAIHAQTLLGSVRLPPSIQALIPRPVATAPLLSKQVAQPSPSNNSVVTNIRSTSEVEDFLKASRAYKALVSYCNDVLKNDVREHSYFCGLVSMNVDKYLPLNGILEDINKIETLHELNNYLQGFYEGRGNPSSQYELLNMGQNVTTRFFGLKTSTISKMDDFKNELEDALQTRPRQEVL